MTTVILNDCNDSNFLLNVTICTDICWKYTGTINSLRYIEPVRDEILKRTSNRLNPFQHPFQSSLYIEFDDIALNTSRLSVVSVASDVVSCFTDWQACRS